MHTAAMSGRQGGAQWPLGAAVVGLASGSWCGAERQRCGASGSPLM